MDSTSVSTSTTSTLAVDIDNDLHRRAKSFAAQRGITLRQMTVEAIEEWLERKSPTPTEIRTACRCAVRGGGDAA